MVSQMELLLGKAFYGEGISRQKNSTEAVLKGILGKPQKHIKILSVHGSMVFNTCLQAAIPDAFTRIQCGLREYRSKPHFDMLFYTYSQNTAKINGGFGEDLCYCRMLLRPGGSLFLVMEGTVQWNAAGCFTKKRTREVSWLRQSGFVNITTLTVGTGPLCVGGQRP